MAAFAGLTVRTVFSPYEDTTGEFLKFVSSAKKSITVLIYGWHLPAMTDVLIAKHQAGVKVALILDHTQAEGKAESQEVQRLVDAGIPFLIGTSPVHHQILHSKFTIVDGKAVEVGSWNYSLSASQQSNTLTFIESKAYARTFLQHWQHIKAFIQLHEMAIQTQGEAPIPAA